MNKPLFPTFALSLALLAGCSLSPTLPSQPEEKLPDHRPAQADMSDYESQEYGFGFSYPANYTPMEQEGNKQNSISFTQEGKLSLSVKWIPLEALKGDYPEVKEEQALIDKAMAYYLDSQAVETLQIAGVPAKKFVLENGYCDGPSCTDPLTAFKLYDSARQKLIEISFMGRSAQEIEGVISSFRLIGPGEEKEPKDVGLTSPTEGWKTLSEDWLGFTLQYPGDWVAQDDSKNNIAGEFVTLVPPAKSSPYDTYLSIAKDGRSLEEMREIFGVARADAEDKEEPVKIGLMDAYAFGSDAFPEQKQILLPHKGGSYSILTSHYRDENVQKILASFRLIGPGEEKEPKDVGLPLPTEGWKTFSEDGADFTLKYPGDWVVRHNPKTSLAGESVVLAPPVKDSPSDTYFSIAEDGRSLEEVRGIFGGGLSNPERKEQAVKVGPIEAYGFSNTLIPDDMLILLPYGGGSYSIVTTEFSDPNVQKMLASFRLGKD